MDELTKPRRGRPRKVVDDVETTGKGESSHSGSDGDRGASEETNSRYREEKITWLDIQARLEAIERTHPDKRIVSASIPEVIGTIPEIHQGVYGGYRITKGPFKVKWNTGEEE